MTSKIRKLLEGLDGLQQFAHFDPHSAREHKWHTMNRDGELSMLSYASEDLAIEAANEHNAWLDSQAAIYKQILEESRV